VRILFVTGYALPHIGGVEVVVDGLAQALRERGHEVVHVSSDAVRADDPPTSDGPDDVIRVAASNVLEDRLDVPYPLFGPALVRVLNREVPRADVVNVHGFLYMGTIVALLRARTLRPPARPVRILTEHVGHVEYTNPVLDRGEAAAIASLGRACARLSDGVVVLNEKVEREMRTLAVARPVVTIPNGLDTHAYRPPTHDERGRLRAELGWDERPRVLFVGRLVAKKGIDVALAAAARGGGEFELVVVGPGTLAAAPHTQNLGTLPRARVACIYRAADAFVLPSRGEGFPVTAQEAMASGLPLVLSDDPAYRPLIAGAGAGVTLVPPEPAPVADALLALIRNPKARTAAAAEAAAYARNTFSWPHAAERYERLFTELGARQR